MNVIIFILSSYPIKIKIPRKKVCQFLYHMFVFPLTSTWNYSYLNKFMKRGISVCILAKRYESSIKLTSPAIMALSNNSSRYLTADIWKQYALVFPSWHGFEWPRFDTIFYAIKDPDTWYVLVIKIDWRSL